MCISIRAFGIEGNVRPFGAANQSPREHQHHRSVDPVGRGGRGHDLLFCLRFAHWVIWPLCVLLFPAGVWADQWPSWRGGESHGVSSASTGPTSWSAIDGIGWSTTISGRGHSSPVVAGDKVIVTTAYVATRTELLRRVLSYVRFFLVTLLSLLTLRLIVQLCGTSGDGFLRLWHLCTAWALGMIVVCLLLLYFFAASAIDYDRCVIRSWLGSSIVFSLCVILSEFRAPPQSRWRLATGLASIFFAVFVVLGMPSFDHAFRGSSIGPSAAVVLAVASIPCFVGISCILNYFFSRPVLGAQNELPLRRTRRRAVVAQCVLVGLGVLGVVALGVIIVSSRLTSYLIASGGEGSDTSSWVPIVGWIVGVLLMGGCFLFAAIAGHLPTECSQVQASRRVLLLRLALAGGGVVLCLVGGGTLFAIMVSGSDFLTYHLASPTWTLELGVWSIIALVSLCLLYLVFQLIRAKPGERASSSRRNLRCVALIVAGITFLCTNFLTVQSALVRAIICLDRSDGRILWVHEGLPGPEGQLHKDNSPATPTPVIIGDRVYAYFGSQGVLCVSLEGGDLIWSNTSKDILHHSVYGASTSPVSSDGVFIIVNPILDGGGIVALDCETGELLWKNEVKGLRDNFNMTFNRSPIMVSFAGRNALVLWDLVGLTAYEPRTGVELYNCAFGNGDGDRVANPICDDEHLYFVSPKEAVALRLASLMHAETVEEVVVWRSRVKGPNCSTPVLCQGKLFMVSDNGVASCLDAKTGELMWRQRLKGRFFSSPVSVGSFVYFNNLAGVTTIVAAESKFREVAQADLGEETYASFAPVSNGFIIRTGERVVFITGVSDPTKAHTD